MLRVFVKVKVIYNEQDKKAPGQEGMIFAVFPPFGLFLGLHNALLGSHSGRTNLSAQFFSKLSLPRGFLEVNDEGRQKSLALLA